MISGKKKKKRSTDFTDETHFKTSKGKDVNIFTYSAQLPNEALWQFYAAVQTAKGKVYSITSYMALRAGTALFLSMDSQTTSF